MRELFLNLFLLLFLPAYLAAQTDDRDIIHTWFMENQLECHISVATNGNAEASDYCKTQINRENGYGHTSINVGKLLYELQQDRVKTQKKVSSSKKKLKDIRSSLKSARQQDSDQKARKLKKSLSKLRSQLKSRKTSLEELRRSLSDANECKKRGKSICNSGEKPERCTPEGCYGVAGTNQTLNDSYVGHAEISPSVVKVGDVITATAYPYDDNYGVTWPDLGDQIGECGYKSTSCSWVATAATDGWREANFGISGYFGQGSEEVAYMVIP